MKDRKIGLIAALICLSFIFLSNVPGG